MTFKLFGRMGFLGKLGAGAGAETTIMEAPDEKAQTPGRGAPGRLPLIGAMPLNQQFQILAAAFALTTHASQTAHADSAQARQHAQQHHTTTGGAGEAGELSGEQWRHKRAERDGVAQRHRLSERHAEIAHA